MNGTGASFASETVWNWGGGSGSSGGVSSFYAIPSWQTGISMTASLGSTAQRNIPDVAMVADNVFTYDSDGSPDDLGGTSCAAPLWAGFIALVNQQAANLGQSPAGFVNPAIYAVGKGQNSSYAYSACFHDTTTGNNFWSGSRSQYRAVTGYDLCTGWGTPNGASLINALANASTVTVTVPTGGLSVSPQDISGHQRVRGRTVQSDFGRVSGDQHFFRGCEVVIGQHLVVAPCHLHQRHAGGILLDECRREPHGGGEHVEAGDLLNFPDL